MTGLGGCCALAANGHTAAPPSIVMNSRRRIVFPVFGTTLLSSQLPPSKQEIAAGGTGVDNHCALQKPGAAHVSVGSKGEELALSKTGPVFLRKRTLAHPIP